MVRVLPDSSWHFRRFFPDGATLIEKHAKEKKRRVGFDGTSRGRVAAGTDAVGAAMWALGLIAFAILIWRFLPSHSTPAVIPVAGLAWLAISVLAWWVRKAVHKSRAVRGREVA